jgi:hyperosmotically inducible protein
MDISRRRMMGLAGALVAGVTAAGLAGCASPNQPETKRTTGEFASDAALTAKVKSAIATDVGARTAAAINVETYRGVVQLSGFVSSEEQANRTVSAAKKVQGVRSVRNDIRLKRS